eukprot:5748634-Pyramimonas_sp.AAC.1
MPLVGPPSGVACVFAWGRLRPVGSGVHPRAVGPDPVVGSRRTPGVTPGTGVIPGVARVRAR